LTAHGEVWLVDADKPRPAIILTRNPVAKILGAILVVPVTTRVRGLAVEVPVGPPDGVRLASVANLDQTQLLRRGAFLHRLGRARPATMRAICEALHLAVDC
jgi:mRNA interferase MazF